MFSRFWGKRHRVVSNYFQTAYASRALLIYVDRPFFKPVNYKHNNQVESLEMAKVLHELGYRVDVVNHDSPAAIDYARYDVLFGMGKALDNLFMSEAARWPKTIFYGCGTYPPFSNRAGLDRLDAVYQRRGVWLPGSARLGNPGLGVERLVDGLIVLGNGFTAGTYRAATTRPVYELPLFFLQVADSADIMAARDPSQARRHFIWFSGTGLLHKGLDLALEAFSRHPELHLHVYGQIEREAAFTRAFQHELRELPNVHVEGYLSLRSPEFRTALLASAFTISPSCSEACSSSVLNICGNGGQIPLLTGQCGIDILDFGIEIRGTTVEAVEAALLEASALSEAELDRRQRSSAAFFRKEHSLERYHQRMKDAVQAILAGKAT